MTQKPDKGDDVTCSIRNFWHFLIVVRQKKWCFGTLDRTGHNEYVLKRRFWASKFGLFWRELDLTWVRYQTYDNNKKTERQCFTAKNTQSPKGISAVGYQQPSTVALLQKHRSVVTRQRASVNTHNHPSQLRRRACLCHSHQLSTPPQLR